MQRLSSEARSLRFLIDEIYNQKMDLIQETRPLCTRLWD